MTSTSPTSVPVLTIDGPSGAGKGTVARLLAQRLGWHLLDSGAVYRAVAASALDQGVAPEDLDGLVRLCEQVDLVFELDDDGVRVLLGGRNADARIRQEEVAVMSSRIASVPAVRAALLTLQRSFRISPGLVADGRDMGTVVFPDAICKVFLTASPEERAHRRFEQLKQKGKDVIFERLFQDLLERDQRDRERAVSPTQAAPGALLIDSTDLTIDQVVDRIMNEPSLHRP